MPPLARRSDERRVGADMASPEIGFQEGRAIRMRPGRRNERPDPWPVLRGMMRKGQAVHCSGHLEVGEQYVDAAGVAL
jgi:hypothetical protein